MRTSDLIVAAVRPTVHFVLAVIVFSDAVGQTSHEQRSLTSEDVGDLVAALDSPNFSSRRSASHKLESLGKEAYPALANAAIERGPETTQRVLDILKAGLNRSDAVTKDTAKKEVERIAASKNLSAARAAQELLHDSVRPKPTFSAIGRRQMGVLFGGRGNVPPRTRRGFFPPRPMR